jgi:hypothetical protein
MGAWSLTQGLLGNSDAAECYAPLAASGQPASVWEAPHFDHDAAKRFGHEQLMFGRDCISLSLIDSAVQISVGPS